MGMGMGNAMGMGAGMGMRTGMGMGYSGGSAGPGRSWGGGDGRGGISAMDVEEFIRNNRLDERAADALREAPADVQETVISRGDLSETRNPSSALIGRLRDA